MMLRVFCAVTEEGTWCRSHNLGVLYQNQGKLDEAEKMYQRALQGYEKAPSAETVMTYASDCITSHTRRSPGRKPFARALLARSLILTYGDDEDGDWNDSARSDKAWFSSASH